jgi:hypothetical protein
MNGKSGEALSKKAKNGRVAASNQFSARFVRSDSQSRCAGETARKLQRPRASMQAGVTGTTTMTVRVRP